MCIHRARYHDDSISVKCPLSYLSYISLRQQTQNRSPCRQILMYLFVSFCKRFLFSETVTPARKIRNKPNAWKNMFKKNFIRASKNETEFFSSRHKARDHLNLKNASWIFIPVTIDVECFSKKVFFSDDRHRITNSIICGCICTYAELSCAYER